MSQEPHRNTQHATRNTTAEIIAIGNELLIGQTLDTNTNWLCKQITGLGGDVRRAVTVRDELDAIARELHDALERGTDVIITTGGLGPTGDDRTLEAVAKALDRPQSENEEALQMIERRYNELYDQDLVDEPGLNDARRKMGRLPQGGQPVFNPVGGAPAVRLDVPSTGRRGELVEPSGQASTIITLPGVPQELKGIWQGPLEDSLTELFGEGAYLETEIVADCPDDSILAPLLKEVVDRHPEVYIKSHVKAFGHAAGRRPEIKVTFSMAGDTREEVEAGIEDAMGDFEETLNEAGFGVRREA